METSDGRKRYCEQCAKMRKKMFDLNAQHKIREQAREQRKKKDEMLARLQTENEILRERLAKAQSEIAILRGKLDGRISI